MNSRPGFSLLEVLVVLVLIALMATISTLAVRSAAPGESEWRNRLLSARRQAAHVGLPVSGYVDSVGAFTVYPNGLIASDSAPGLRFMLEANAGGFFCVKHPADGS
jgi:prepilin-type N-terminal cleavage/methylation domain-containing protein